MFIEDLVVMPVHSLRAKTCPSQGMMDADIWDALQEGWGVKRCLWNEESVGREVHHRWNQNDA